MFFEFPDGATPIHDSSDLLLPWIQNMKDLNRAEAENISQAQGKHLRFAPQDCSSWFHLKELQSIHHAMFGNVWGWAGKIRGNITSIGVDPGLIRLKLFELIEEVANWDLYPIELTFLEKSARIHHRMVFIHPFENGNGRFSRLVADRSLLCWKCSHPIWPEDLYYDGFSRRRYIKALQAADKSDYDPLLSLMREWGASDPDLHTLFQDSFFKSYMQTPRGIAKINALVRQGKHPNHPSPNGHYPLHLIIKSKLHHVTKLELVKHLASLGANIHQIDKQGLTPFQIAVTIGDKEIALFLLSKGARRLAPPGTGYAKYYALFQQIPPS